MIVFAHDMDQSHGRSGMVNYIKSLHGRVLFEQCGLVIEIYIYYRYAIDYLAMEK